MRQGRLIKVEIDTLRRVEIDDGAVRKHELPRCCDSVDAAVGIVGIDQFRRQTAKSQHDRLVGAVPTPSTRQRPEQRDLQAFEARSRPSSARMNAAAAFMGPMVCDEDGPIPILNRSKTLII